MFSSNECRDYFAPNQVVENEIIPFWSLSLCIHYASALRRQAEKLLHPFLMQSNFSRMALNQVMANNVLYPRKG